LVDCGEILAPNLLAVVGKTRAKAVAARHFFTAIQGSSASVVPDPIHTLFCGRRFG